MSSIMEGFREATDGIREEAQDNDELFEAMQTEKNDAGVRIAEWQINITEGNPGKKYDVYRDDVEIAKDLRLYEAALILMKELNKGETITSPTIMTALQMEASYAKHLKDAIGYRNMMKTATGKKKAVASDRLDESKRAAMTAKGKLKKLFDSRY